MAEKELSLGAAEGCNAAVLNAGDEVVVAGDVAVEIRESHADVFFFMCVGAAEALLVVFVCQLLCQLVGLDGLAGVEAFNEVEFSDQVGVFGQLAEQHCAGAAHSKWMGRAQDAAEVVYQLDQEFYGHSADLQGLQFDAIGHDYQKMTGVLGIVLYAHEDHKVCGHLLAVVRTPLIALV